DRLGHFDSAAWDEALLDFGAGVQAAGAARLEDHRAAADRDGRLEGLALAGAERVGRAEGRRAGDVADGVRYARSHRVAGVGEGEGDLASLDGTRALDRERGGGWDEALLDCGVGVQAAGAARLEDHRAAADRDGRLEGLALAGAERVG